MAELNEKQKLFCEEYLVHLVGSKAAEKAGYAPSRARVTACELLKKPEVREYIGERMEQKRNELIADQNEVMKYLTAVMRRELTESVVVTLSRETSSYVPDMNGKMRKETVKEEFPEIVKIPARLSDANKAAELLGKAYVLFTDKVSNDVDMELNITVDYGDNQND